MGVFQVTGAPARLLSILLTLALALPAVVTLGVLAATPAAAAVPPEITITKDGPGQVLVGDTATYNLTATNPTGDGQVPQYNLSFRDVLPVGVVYEGPTTPSSAGAPTIYTNRLVPSDPTTEYQTLVWSNVADLQINSSADISFIVRALRDPKPVSSTFTNQAGAYTNEDPRYVPKFDANGVAVPGATSYTASATATTSMTDVTAFTISKSSSPNPEGELMRGIHDHVATYSVKVTNNPSYATNQIEIRDYLPPGLEFLGCGTVDNSTPTALYPTGREYPTAPKLNAGAPVANCLVPDSVETITGPLSDSGRDIPAGVFTKVTWSVGDFAVGQVKTITYRAGIPQRANTADWQATLPGTGTAPAPAINGGGTIGTQPPQTANLDNNTGPSTRETATEQSLTNVVVGDGLYTGPVPGQPGPTVPVASSTQHTVTAEDLAMQKSVAPGTFVAGAIATYTLKLQVSEYVSASGIVITDLLPNGVCPVWSTQSPTVTGVLPADCGTGGSPAGSDPTGATLSTVTRNSDGTFRLIFAPLAAAANGTITVTYQGRMRTEYTGGSLVGLPTSSGDTYTNTVSLVGTTDTRADVNAPSPTGPLTVEDNSSATQSSTQPSIDKRIKPNVSGALGYRCEQGTGTFTPGAPVNVAGAAEYVDPATAAPPLTADQISFRKGSIVCFLLRVEFPSQSQTRNPVVTDFLPAGTSYVPNSAVVTANSTLTGGDVAFSQDSAGNPVWRVGQTNAGNRFAPKSAVFEVVLAVSIDDAAAGAAPDIVGNLMKFRSENSAGQAISLRDQLDFAIAPLPPVALVKGISRITPKVQPPAPSNINVPPAAPTNVDGRTVRDGDVVQFRIDVSNTSNTLGPDYASSVRGLDIWDKLPAGVPCASVANPAPTSGPGVVFSCLDPTDPGYPTAGGSGRSLLRWVFDDSDAQAIAAGARRTLTYDFTVPQDVSVAIRLTDNAGVRSYQAFTNLPGVAATYFPASNIDTSVPVADRDAPRADDPSNVRIANVDLAKTGTTAITEDNNNAPTQATIGELVTYTVTATVPYGTSVYQGVMTDTLPDGLTYASSAADYSTDNQSTWTTTLPAGTVLANNGQLVTLTLPTSYTAASGAVQNHVFRVSITARVSSNASNAHGVARTNTVSFLSKASAAPGAGNVTAPTAKSYDVTVVEPSPLLDKEVDRATVSAGDVVTYTLTASNATGRPPLHDTWVIDCLPAGLTFGGYLPDTRTDVLAPVPGDDTNGCTTGQTRLAWNPTSPDPTSPPSVLPPGTLLSGSTNEVTLGYTATVASTSAGLTTYVNNAILSGGTLQDGTTDPLAPPNPLERTYTDPASATVTVRGAAALKTVDPEAATIGETATWSIRILVPRNVNFYRAAVIDEVLPGIDLTTIKTLSVECRTVTPNPTCAVGSAPLDPAAGPRPGSTLIGWYLGDLPAVPYVREVIVTYSGRVDNITGPPQSPVRGDSLMDYASGRWFTDPGAPVPTSAGASFDRMTDEASAAVTVQEPQVAITKGVTPTATPAPGDVFTYTVTASNNSGANVSTAHGVVVSDAVPVGVVVDAASISDGGVFTPPAAPANPALGGGTITWPAIDAIAPGGSRDLTYQARLAPSASLTASGKLNTASVTRYTSLPEPGAGDPANPDIRVYTGPSADQTVTPRFPRITPAKSTPNGALAYIGEPFTWRLTLTNSGQSRAYGVDAVDTLPANWTYTATSSVLVAGAAQTPAPTPTLGTSGARQTLTWTDLGALNPGQTIVVTFTATPQPGAAVDAGAGSGFAHTNTVATAAEDATGAQGSAAGPYNAGPASAVARIHSADLVVDKGHLGTPVAGETFDWTIDVRNAGPDTAVGPFTVTDTVEAPMSFVSASGPGWTCSAAGAVVSCTRANAADTLANGASFPRITLRVAIPSDAPVPMTLSNTAQVSGRTFDPNIPNRDTDTVPLTAQADLAIAKARSGALEAGRNVTYTLNVSNLGPSTSRGPITVTDAVPTGTTFVSASGAGWTCPAAGAAVSTVTCTRAGDLLAGQAAPQITLTLAVDSDLTGQLTNTARVSGTTPDPVAGNNSSSSTGTIVTLADVAIEKTHAGGFVPGTPDATRSNSYTFTVTNFGPAVAVAPVTVVDLLPEHLSWTGTKVDVSGAWSCAADPTSAPAAPDRQEVTCTLSGDLAVGQTRAVRLDIAVDVDAPATGTFENTATVSTGTTDPKPGNNTSTDRTDFDSQADLAIAKTPTSQTVVAGEPGGVTWQLSVTNNGPSNSVGPTVVTDLLPADVALVSAQGAGWDACSLVDRTITCSHPDGVAAGGSLPPIEVVATVAAAAGPATLVNSASVDGPTPDPDPSNNTDEAEVIVRDEADLEIVKTFTGANPVAAGAETTFSLAVENLGPSDADNVIVGDELPAGLSLVSASGGGWDCSDAGQVVTCQRDSLPANTSAPVITLTVQVDSGQPAGVIRNTATVTSATPDPETANNTSTDRFAVTTSADLVLAKTHDADQVPVAGEPFTFEVTVRNDGPSDAKAPIVVEDSLPVGLSYVSNGAGWTCTTSGTPAVDEVVTCTLDSADPLISGAQAPILELTTQIAADADPGEVTNAAEVTSGTPDPTPDNNRDTDPIEVTTLADLVVTKSHAGPAAIGQELEFTIAVSNEGPSEARSVTMVDTLPDGLAYVSAQGADWTCAAVGQQVTCTLGSSLAPMSQADPITLVVSVGPAAYPTAQNVATVATETPEVSTGNNTATDVVAIPPLVDLAVTKSHVGDFTVGEQGTYTIMVTNNGPTSDPGPQTLTDTLPAGLTYVAAQGTGWDCTASGQDVECVRDAALAVDGSSEVTLTVSVGPAAAPSVINVASVSTPSAETTTENNTATDPTVVIPVSNLTIVKDVADQDGRVVTYSIIVGNDGPNATTSAIVVSDPLPDGLGFVSVSGDGWTCTEGQVVTCTYAASLPVGGTAGFELVAELTAKPGTEVVNVATVVAGGSGGGDVSDDAGVVSPDEDTTGGGGSSNGGLADTGADVSLVAWALLLVLAGWSAVGLSRRRRAG